MPPNCDGTPSLGNPCPSVSMPRACQKNMTHSLCLAFFITLSLSLSRSLSLTQYAILMTMVLTTFIKYILHTIDLQSENPWENKAVYMLYTELFTGGRFLSLNSCGM